MRKRLSVSFVAVFILSAFTAVVPAQAIDCYPPGSCDGKPTADYKSVPSLNVQIGSVKAENCRGRKCSDSKASLRTRDGELVIEVSRRAFATIVPVSPAGQPMSVGSSFAIPEEGGVRIILSGLKPGTYADVYVNESPEFLGKVLVAGDGTATTTLPLDDDVDRGLRTLQIIGTTSSGDILSVGTGTIVYNQQLPNSKPRYLIYDAKPDKGERVKSRRNIDLSVKLVDVKEGELVVGSVANSLPACTVKVAVTDERGRTLLAQTCMSSTNAGRDSAKFTWSVPSGLSGKANIVFTAQETGRTDDRLTREISLQR